MVLGRFATPKGSARSLIEIRWLPRYAQQRNGTVSPDKILPVGAGWPFRRVGQGAGRKRGARIEREVVSGAAGINVRAALVRVQEVKPSLHGNVNSGALQVGHCTCAARRNPAKFDRFRRDGRFEEEGSTYIRL